MWLFHDRKAVDSRSWDSDQRLSCTGSPAPRRLTHGVCAVEGGGNPRGATPDLGDSGPVLSAQEAPGPAGRSSRRRWGTPTRGKPQEEAGFRSFVSEPELGTRSRSPAQSAGRRPSRSPRGVVEGWAWLIRPRPIKVFKSGRPRSRQLPDPPAAFLCSDLASSARRVLPPPTRVSPRKPVAPRSLSSPPLLPTVLPPILPLLPHFGVR